MIFYTDNERLAEIAREHERGLNAYTYTEVWLLAEVNRLNDALRACHDAGKNITEQNDRLRGALDDVARKHADLVGKIVALIEEER